MMKVKTNFELLPNEIVIECFQYLNAFDIFHSFDQLNSRFNKLIRNIPLSLNFENVRKRIFDRFCTEISLNPQMKQHIYSLNLSNKDSCGQAELFLKLFSLNEFSNLRSVSLTNIHEDDAILLKSMLPLMPQLFHFHLIYHFHAIAIAFDDKINEMLSVLPMSQLRTLSVSKLELGLISTNQISSITKLTINYTYNIPLSFLFEYMPMLKYLHIGKLSLDKTASTNCAVHLKELIIDDFEYPFEYFVMLAKQTPNLNILNISASIHKNIVNANAWEHFIKTSLPYLNTFRFKFNIRHGGQELNDIIDMFKQFQSHFWQIEHHWHTAYVLDINSALIFTIPYYLNTYELVWYTDSYSDKSVNHFNLHDKVTNLKLHNNLSIKKYPYYFSNVTELDIAYLWPSDIKNCLFTEENIIYFKEKVNLSKLKKLDLKSFRIEPSILLQILKESPQLSEMTIDTDLIRSFFNNSELCEYLSKMIKKLVIMAHSGYHNMEKFYDVFSSLQTLNCGFVRMSSENGWNFWISLINHLSQFSAISLCNISTEWIYEEQFFSQLQNEATKRNLIFQFIPYDRNESEPYQTTLKIWVDEKMD